MWDALGVFVRLNRTNFLLAYGWMRPWVYGLTLIVRPAAQVIFFGVMARFITGQADVSFQIIGNTIQVMALASLYTVAESLVLQRRNGTLAIVALAPRSRFFVFGGQIWLLGLHGIIITGAALAIGAYGFGLDLGRANWPLLIGAIVTAVFATSCLGTALGSLGLYLPDIDLSGNITAGILLTLCGINFPLEALPAALRTVAYALPMTRSVAAARLAVTGEGTGVALLLGKELALGLVWLAVGFVVYAWAERKARKHATLEMF
jgi:ABC-2 type transport system permease protein